MKENIEVKELTIADLEQVLGGIQIPWHDYMMFPRDISVDSTQK